MHGATPIRALPNIIVESEISVAFLGGKAGAFLVTLVSADAGAGILDELASPLLDGEVDRTEAFTASGRGLSTSMALS
jgi:hypothetical protein